MAGPRGSASPATRLRGPPGLFQGGRNSGGHSHQEVTEPQVRADRDTGEELRACSEECRGPQGTTGQLKGDGVVPGRAPLGSPASLAPG